MLETYTDTAQTYTVCNNPGITKAYAIEVKPLGSEPYILSHIDYISASQVLEWLQKMAREYKFRRIA